MIVRVKMMQNRKEIALKFLKVSLFSSTVATLNMYPATHLVVQSTLRDSALISPILTLLAYPKVNI